MVGLFLKTSPKREDENLCKKTYLPDACTQRSQGDEVAGEGPGTDTAEAKNRGKAAQ
jgi:hypothetical protein